MLHRSTNRINNHIFDIVHFLDVLTNVSEHFNSSGHNIQYCSFMPVEKRALQFEKTCIHILGTITPVGMNSKKKKK